MEMDMIIFNCRHDLRIADPDLKWQKSIWLTEIIQTFYFTF